MTNRMTFKRVQTACSVGAGILKGGDFVTEAPKCSDRFRGADMLICVAYVQFSYGPDNRRAVTFDIYEDGTFFVGTSTCGSCREAIEAYGRASKLIEALDLTDFTS